MNDLGLLKPDNSTLYCKTGMPDIFRLTWKLLFCVLFIMSVGCNKGPDAMRASRILYNDSLQQTERRELLLNLVRLRYAESPEFLGVSSISTQFSYDFTVSVGGVFGTDAGDPTHLGTPGVGAGFSERPTITFIPRTDPEFAQQLLTPLDPGVLVNLINYGWAMDRTLRVTVKTINELNNGTTREFSETKDEDDLIQFARAAKILNTLNKKGDLSLTTEDHTEKLSGPLNKEEIHSQDILAADKEGYHLKYSEEEQSYFLIRKNPVIVLSLKENALNDPLVRKMEDLLNLQPGLKKYIIHDKTNSVQKDSLMVRTRSILGILAYLSQGVEVPPSHLRLLGGAKNKETLKATNTILRDLFQVKVTDTEPDNAVVSIPFREHWFYIDDEDLSSKRTLGLLSYLVKLKINAGGVQNVPVLTLPVGR